MDHNPGVIILEQRVEPDPGQCGDHMLVRNISELGPICRRIKGTYIVVVDKNLEMVLTKVCFSNRMV